MAITEHGKCKILSLNNQGLGVAQTDLGTALLPYTIPGEIVEFERHQYRRESNCVLKAIIEPSTARVQPVCKYFGVCGGCLLQHLNDENYYQFKYEAINQALKTVHIQTNINPIITIQAGMRRRANLEAIKKNDQIFLGFHRFRSHQIINIDECPALLPKLSNLLAPLKSALAQILENRQKAQIFLTEASNGTDITLTIQEQSLLNDQQRLILSDFATDHAITRFIFRYRKLLDIIQEIAQPYIIFDDIAVKIDAYGFLQSNFLSDKILADLVLDFFMPANCQKQDIAVVDLFCGRGTYTIPLARHFKVDGFESDHAAISALGEAILNTDRQINLVKRDLFSLPLTAQELSSYNAVVINPPRAGAETQCHQLKTSTIDKICYISCNPETFARDAQILCSGNYQLNEVTPVDQFYWSPHLEVVGFFQRNGSANN
jgi:23S rRNA (uracil1939-C5)-methyltransferase